MSSALAFQGLSDTGWMKLTLNWASSSSPWRCSTRRVWRTAQLRLLAQLQGLGAPSRYPAVRLRQHPDADAPRLHRAETRRTRRRRCRRRRKVRMATPVISIRGLGKRYASGQEALKRRSRHREGRDFRSARPERRGQDHPDQHRLRDRHGDDGSVEVDGLDIVADYREARSRIGLVPQELHTDAFESVWSTVSFSRGLFGRPPDPAFIESVLATCRCGTSARPRSWNCRAA